MTRQSKSIIAACLISTAGAIVYLISPILIGSSMDSLGLSANQAGITLSVYFAGYTLLPISAVFWLHLFKRQPVAWISTAVLVFGLLAAAWSTALPTLMITMFISGAGAGMLYGLFVTLVAESKSPDRNFGYALAVQLALGSVILFFGPAVLAPRWGFGGILIGTAIFVVVICLCIPWIPEAVKPSDSRDETKSPDFSMVPVFTSITALLLWFTGFSGIYAFVERIGVSNGLEGLTIGAVLSATLITGIAGAMSAAWLGNRFGRRNPHLAGMAGTTVAIILLTGSPDLVRFSLAIGFLTFSWNFWLAYLLGAIALADVQGRFAVLTTAALGIGATLGPGIAGSLVSGSNFTSIFVFGGLLITIGLLTVLWAISNMLKNVSYASSAE